MSKVSADIGHSLNLFGARRKSRVLAGLLASAVVLVGAAQAAPSASITQTSLAGVKLGLTAGAYAAAFHETPFVTHYADGRAQLAFSKADLIVMLAKNGRGASISTESSRYLLRGGVGPCSDALKLQRLYRPAALHVQGAFGTENLVYRVGRHLWVTLRTPQAIGRITLSAQQPVLRSLLAAAQCGAGEGEGE